MMHDMFSSSVSQAPAWGRVEELELDLNSGRLTRNGREVELTPRSLQVLMYLVQNQPRVVARDELFRALWSDVMVAEGSLTQAIWQIRQVLAGGRKHCRFIETRYGIGYQFVGSIEPLPESSTVRLSPHR